MQPVGPKKQPSQIIESINCIKDKEGGALAASLMDSGLDSLTIDNEFTPSTPYVHKFRTEMCKNWQLYGKCKWGDEVSTNFQI